MKAFLIVMGIYVVSAYAIFRADFYCIDDMGRAFRGYKEWGYYGRIISEALSAYVHTGNYLCDVSPLTQILSLGIVTLSGMMMLYAYLRRTRFYIWELIALIPLGLNPYFLECLSYKYDSPYMALSILGATFPMLFLEESMWVSIYTIMIGVVITCTSYQAATGIFPMLVLLYVLRMWINKAEKKEILLMFVKAIVGYSLGILFFMAVIMIPTDPSIVVQSNHLPELSQFIPNTLNNLMTYYKLVMQDFKSWWNVTIVCMVVCAGYSIIKQSKQNRLHTLLVYVAYIVINLCMVFGLYIALEQTNYDSRAMYGFGVFLSIIAISTSQYKESTVLYVPYMIISWVFVVFTFIYGNTLNVQKQYVDFRIQMIINDVDELLVNHEGKVNLQLSGNIGDAPLIRNMPHDNQILFRLLPKALCGGGVNWSNYGFYHYYDLNKVDCDMTVDMQELDLPVIKESIYHTIRGEGNYILIELKDDSQVN